MAEIYAKASRVLVWLGEEEADSSEAVQRIHKAADDLYAPKDLTQDAASEDEPVLALLERTWFRRIWVSNSPGLRGWRAALRFADGIEGPARGRCRPTRFGGLRFQRD
jgi:hypothetical protein